MSFPVEKRVDLSFLGSKWQGAEIILSGLTFKETRELSGQNFDADDPESTANNMNFVTEFLGKHFIGGKAWNGSELVDLTSKDIEDLPVEVVNKAVEALTGQVDPKS